MPPSRDKRINFKRLAVNRVKIVNQLRKRIKNVSKIWMQLQLNKGNQAVQMTVLIMAPSPLSILLTIVFTLIRFCESEANPQTYLMPRRFKIHALYQVLSKAIATYYDFFKKEQNYY